MKFSRDRRGYEHFYLVQQTFGRRGKSRPRILFWFRTPPNVRVGREPFTDDVKRALEAQYPDVAFDWTKLKATPIPPPEAERWRERRRAELSARQGRPEVASTDEDDRQNEEDDEGRAGEGVAPGDAPEPLAGSGGEAAESFSQTLAENSPENRAENPAAAGFGTPALHAPGEPGERREPRKRRRRRRRHRRRGPSPAEVQSGPLSSSVDAPQSEGNTEPPGSSANAGDPGRNEDV